MSRRWPMQTTIGDRRGYILRHLRQIGYFAVAGHAHPDWHRAVESLTAQGYLQPMIGPREHEQVAAHVAGPELRDGA